MNQIEIDEDDDWSELDEAVEECEDCGVLSKNLLCPFHQDMKDQLYKNNQLSNKDDKPSNEATS